MIIEFLFVHPVQHRLVPERTEIDTRFGLVPCFKGHGTLDFCSLRLEQHVQHFQPLIGGVGCTEVQPDKILMNERELAVRIKLILVSGSAADQGDAPRRRGPEMKPPFQLRIIRILHGPRGIDLDHIAQPAEHTPDHRDVFIGIVSPTLKILLHSVSHCGIFFDEFLALRRVRLHRAEHFLAACFILFQAEIIDPDILQIAQLLPGRVDVFRLVVRFSAQFPVCTVLKKDVLPRDQRIYHGKHDQHDDQD